MRLHVRRVRDLMVLCNAEQLWNPSPMTVEYCSATLLPYITKGLEKDMPPHLLASQQPVKLSDLYSPLESPVSKISTQCFLLN